MADNISFREKLTAVWRVAQFRPLFTIGIILLSVLAALLEGIGIGFLLPIIREARDSGETGTIMELFIQTYEFLGVPFTLETIIVGVALIMAARYISSFLVAWLRTELQATYVRDLQTRAFRNALSAKVSYFDKKGSDEILNTIVTQSREAGVAIMQIIRIVETGLVSLMYFGIALYLAPGLALGTALILGTFTFLIRYILESAYAVGDRMAEAHERVQQVVQAGTQGIREIKIFGLSGDFFARFNRAADLQVKSTVHLRRNRAGIQNFYQLVTAVTVFVLIYVALRHTELSLGAIGIFLFSMFRLAPRVSSLNNRYYQLEGSLPHLVRTQQVISEMKEKREPTEAGTEVQRPVEQVDVKDVSFSYESSEQVLKDISFSVQRGELIAFVGSSGAGKSTIASLLARMYEPDEGEILADGTPIDELQVDEWRNCLSVVRQDPYIFNETLRYNVSLANPDVTDDAIEEACEIAQVTEFLDDLPNGYDTELGDDGVRLSGGQRQRVSVARALLRDADLFVFDEATSDLDTNIEQRVHDGIESIERDQAMILIAHRLSTVRNADRIYTMEDGRIIEVGTHEELMQEDGTYSDLYSTDQSES